MARMLDWNSLQDNKVYSLANTNGLEGYKNQFVKQGKSFIPIDDVSGYGSVTQLDWDPQEVLANQGSIRPLDMGIKAGQDLNQSNTKYNVALNDTTTPRVSFDFNQTNQNGDPAATYMTGQQALDYQAQQRTPANANAKPGTYQENDQDALNRERQTSLAKDNYKGVSLASLSGYGSGGGNQTYSAPTSAQTGGAPTQGAPGTTMSNGAYIIQKGDTLSALARKFGTTVQELMRLNPQIASPNLIYAGKNLATPGGSTSAPQGNPNGNTSNQNADYNWSPETQGIGSNNGNGSSTPNYGSQTETTSTDPILARIQAMLTQSQDAQSKLADLIKSRNAVDTQVDAKPGQVADQTKDYSVNAEQLSRMTSKEVKTLTDLQNSYSRSIEDVKPLAEQGSLDNLFSLYKAQQDNNKPIEVNGQLVQKQADGSYKAVYGQPAQDLPASAKEYQYAVSQGYKGSYQDYQNEDANRKRSVSNTIIQGSGMSPKELASFNTIVTNYNNSPLMKALDRTPILKSSIEAVKKDPGNSALQMNLAYSYIQALDTYQSAVREGELKNLNSIDSKIGSFQNSVQQMQNGQLVRPDVALQIANAAQSIIDTISSSAQSKARTYQAQANQNGTNVSSAFSQFLQEINATTSGTVAGSGKTTSGVGYTITQ